LGRHRVTVHMPNDAEFTVQTGTGLVENAMIRGVATLNPGEDLGDRELAVIDRLPRPGDTAHQAEPRPCLMGGRQRRGPVPVDQRGVEVVYRPVGVEIAAREYRADQSRAQFGCGSVEL